MSRIGKHPVEIIEGVSVEIKGSSLIATGKIGTISVPLTNKVKVELKDKLITVIPADENDRQSNMMWGTTRALIQNAITGVSSGFEKLLTFLGVGYKIALKGNVLDMVLGFSHNVEYKLPEGVKGEVLSPTELKLTSANKELVGQTAAEIRAFRPPEPYKGKGIRYKDEYVRRKEGKKK